MPDWTCFVVMGFGTKTDYHTGRSLDLDKSYRVLIQPAVTAAGLRCIRADDTIHSESIDLSIFRWLLQAEVVVADISTCNPNTLYELGVRHALRPYTTIIMAEDQTVHPFDVGHIVIRKYRHLGHRIDAEDAASFRAELQTVLEYVVERAEVDSPVYYGVPDLKPPVLEVSAYEAPLEPLSTEPDETLSRLTDRAEEALQAGRFQEATTLFLAARTVRHDDYLTQRLALATYKSGVPTERAALEEASTILMELDPEASNDPETLRLWAAVHKRLWKVGGDRAHLDTAIRAYERGFDIRTDYYSGIDLALLLNMRARESSPAADQITDFVCAQRVRRAVVAVCTSFLAEGVSEVAEQYWVMVTLAEAYLGIGDAAASHEWLRKGNELPVAESMRETTAARLGSLRQLLAPSPLELISAS